MPKVPGALQGPPTLPSSPPGDLVLGDGRSRVPTIRWGAEYGLGIYVTGVDPGSEAESSGPKVRETPDSRERGHCAAVLRERGGRFLSV